MHFARFAACSHQFMDAYQHGLNGKQAAWAAKKYHGHCVLLDTIMQELSTSSHHSGNFPGL